ncbi:MAG: hypothetical protein ACNA71_03785, partial [Kiritimatiellia bacterium]
MMDILFQMYKFKYICMIAFSALLAISSQAEVVLVGWTFPETNLVASAGIAANTNQAIAVEGGPQITGFVVGSVSGTQAPSANSWTDGSGAAYWLITFASANYTNITLSSRMSGSGTGPRDFQVQYRV